jgi:hypothetical protein
MSGSLFIGGARAWHGSKIGAALATAFIVLLVGVATAENSPARVEGLDAQGEAKAQPANPGAQDQFLTEAQRRLKKCHERIAAIGPSFLAAFDDVSQAMDQSTNLMITVESARANFQNATLTREVAEIAVVEYEEGIFKQDQATLEGEHILAESDWQRAKDAVEGTKNRLNQIEAASKGTAADVAVIYSYEDNVIDAARREPKAKLAVAQAEAKLKKLRQYTKPITIKKLQSEVEKARADELTKKAVFQLEKAKADRLDARIGRSEKEEPNGLPVAPLTQAFSIDEKIRAELGAIQKNRALDEGHIKTITALITQLEGLVDQAEADVVKATVDRMRASIHDAAVRVGVAKP